jgi:hypothetical protein
VLSALGVVAGCDDSSIGSVSIGSITGPGGLSSPALVTAEPALATPQFLPGLACPTFTTFGVGLTVIVGGQQDLVVLERLRFDFLDQSGRSAVPLVRSTGALPIPTATATPTPGFATIPGTLPIPIPGFSTVPGILVDGGSTRRLPFFLEFGCGIPSAGTVVIGVDVADMHGGRLTSEARVHVAP